MNNITNALLIRISIKQFYPRLRFKSSTVHNLNQVLLKMPREATHTAALKKQRLKLKEKSQKYSAGTVTLQVLGSGAYGAPRCLYMFTDQSRYLFNCGEGTQRLAHEHKMKLSKLEHIFITHPTWNNLGGLPGVALTIQDVGVPEITLHGPAGIDEIFVATRKFVILRDLVVKMSECTESNSYQDNVMKVQYVPIYRRVDKDKNSEIVKHSVSSNGGSPNETSDEDIDYYPYAPGRHSSPVRDQKRKTKRSSSCEPPDPKRRCSDEHPPSSMSMAYICRLHNRAGALLLEACVNYGVPPGPLLGRLKAGEDVTLENGTVVRSSDVTEPDDPGAVFVVVECPTEEFLDSLLEQSAFVPHQQSFTNQVDVAHMVVHFTPSHIMVNPRYKEWMSRFLPSTHHLILNESNSCMGSTAVHRIQYKLNFLDPEVFPLLRDQDSSHQLNNNLNKDFSVCRGHTVNSFHLRPYKTLDNTPKLSVEPNVYIEETVAVDGFNSELALYREKVSQLENIDSQYQEYPKVVFLGTGSCIPNKTRNTSGVLLHISATKCVVIDCGEATFGQMVRLYGVDECRNLFKKLVGVYISHLHADHHIGLVGLLRARANALGGDAQPLYLLAPKQILRWLKLYDSHFESILKDLQIVPLGAMDFKNFSLPSDTKQRLLGDLKMSSILTCPVRHCPNSFGVTFKHLDGWKITYSGDTMPCEALVQLGMDSDLLIHEATMEDELEAEAKIKMHSTTSQAIEIGRDMNAKFTLLTHFSQRYAKLPRFNDRFAAGVGIAFDNMQVTLNDLRKLPLMYPALKLMFAEHHEELEQKAFKRQLRQEMMTKIGT